MDRSQLGHDADFAYRRGLALDAARRSRGAGVTYREINLDVSRRPGILHQLRTRIAALRARSARVTVSAPTVAGLSAAVATPSLGAVVPAPREGIDTVTPAM